MLRGLVSVILIIVCGVTYAAGMTCTPIKIKIQDKNIVLSGPAEIGQIYFFNNTSKQGIWIDHPVAKRSANAGWSSYLRSGNWSSFLLNRKDFVISCAVIEPGKVNYLDCSHAITVCTPKEATFKNPGKVKGSYWLAEDKSWEDVVKATEKRGVVLH